MTRRKREGVLWYVEREATKSGGKITVTAGLYQHALDILRQRARNLRDATAMRKIAVYYDKAMDSGTAYSCRREANDF